MPEMSAPLFNQSYETFFRGNTPEARETGAAGAKAALVSHEGLCYALVALYQKHGPLTDAEAAKQLKVERTSINSCRCSLINRQVVARRPKGKRRNPKSGVVNSTWGLR